MQYINYKYYDNYTKTSTGIQKLWSFSIFAYIVCMIAFNGTKDTAIYNTISLFFFIGISAINILKNAKVRFNSYVLSLVAYGAFLLIAYYYSPVQSQAVGTIYDFFTMCVICICIINYIDTEEKVYFLLNAYIVGGLCLWLYAFSIYGLDIFNTIIRSTYIVRVGAEVGNTNSVGMRYAFSVLFSVFFLINKKNGPKKSMFYIVVIVICSIFALLTGSKKALILLVLGIIVLLLFKKEYRNVLIKKIGLIIFGTCIIVLLVYIIQNVEIFRTVNHRLDDLIQLITIGSGNSSDQKRIRFIKEGLEVFSNYPIFGRGTKASYYYFATYSHNNYVEILMNTGIVGFIIFYCIYPGMILKLLKMYDRKSLFVACGILIMIAYLFLGLGLVYYFERYDQILIAVVSAFVSIISSNKRNSLEF